MQDGINLFKEFISIINLNLLYFDNYDYRFSLFLVFLN